MNTVQINKKLKSINSFAGAFPCDMIPIILNKPVEYIINTDPSTKPGEHWVAVHLNGKGKGEYFDSFGFEPLQNKIIEFLNTTCPLGWKYSTLPLQSINDVTCGHYCIVFTILKSKNYKYQDILNIFTQNSLINDIFVRALIKSL